ncbi:hypothetical protein BDV18DRAFT_159573 [Aspergillus unguis]
MCIIFTTTYLCSCVYDEWHFPCVVFEDLRPRPPGTWCYLRHMKETVDIFSLCELCLPKLEARVRRDGIKKTLASRETFPLAEKLGMLIVLENDERLQRKYFGRREKALIYDREWWVPVTDGAISRERLKEKRPKRRNGQNAWKYEAWRRFGRI